MILKTTIQDLPLAVKCVKCYSELIFRCYFLGGNEYKVLFEGIETHLLLTVFINKTRVIIKRGDLILLETFVITDEDWLLVGKEFENALGV